MPPPTTSPPPRQPMLAKQEYLPHNCHPLLFKLHPSPTPSNGLKGSKFPEIAPPPKRGELFYAKQTTNTTYAPKPPANYSPADDIFEGKVSPSLGLPRVLPAFRKHCWTSQQWHTAIPVWGVTSMEKRCRGLVLRRKCPTHTWWGVSGGPIRAAWRSWRMLLPGAFDRSSSSAV
jgi:hypothetical protein